MLAAPRSHLTCRLLPPAPPPAAHLWRRHRLPRLAGTAITGGHTVQRLRVLRRCVTHTTHQPHQSSCDASALCQTFQGPAPISCMAP
jgi:hypothetical protein